MNNILNDRYHEMKAKEVRKRRMKITEKLTASESEFAI